MILIDVLNNQIFTIQVFVVDILSFLVQNFNPENLDIKLDLEKERDMVKFLWENVFRMNL